MPTIQAIPVPLANALSQEKEIKEMERKNINWAHTYLCLTG